MISKMMDKAVEAQNAQKQAQEVTGLQQGTNATVSSEEGQPTKAISSSTKPVRPRDGVTTTRIRSKASEQHIHIVSTNTPKYASDIRNKGNGGSNIGLGLSGNSSQLPSKKKNKK